MPSRATLGDAEPLPAWSPATENAINELEDLLLRIAESGRRSASRDLGHRLQQHAAELSRVGLATLAGSIADLAHHRGSPAHLLRSRYLCQVHRQAAVRRGLVE